MHEYYMMLSNFKNSNPIRKKKKKCFELFQDLRRVWEVTALKCSTFYQQETCFFTLHSIALTGCCCNYVLMGKNDCGLLSSAVWGFQRRRTLFSRTRCGLFELQYLDWNLGIFLYFSLLDVHQILWFPFWC